MLQWIKQRAEIKNSKKGRKRVYFKRSSEHSYVEEIFHKEYRTLVKGKGWWFKTKAKQLLELIHTEAQLKFSDIWFNGFENNIKVYTVPLTKHSASQPVKKLIYSFKQCLGVKKF